MEIQKSFSFFALVYRYSQFAHYNCRVYLAANLHHDHGRVA